LMLTPGCEGGTLIVLNPPNISSGRLSRITHVYLLKAFVSFKQGPSSKFFGPTPLIPFQPPNPPGLPWFGAGSFLPLSSTFPSRLKLTTEFPGYPRTKLFHFVNQVFSFPISPFSQHPHLKILISLGAACHALKFAFTQASVRLLDSLSPIYA